MKVCRIEKDTVLRKVGEVIEPSSFERIYSEMRSKAELLLESVRSEFYPKLFDRVDSLFVFPYDQ